MINTVYMLQYSSFDEVSSVVYCFNSIPSQADFNEPIHEFRAGKYIFVDFQTPPATIRIIIRL